MSAEELNEGDGLAKLESACASLSGGHSPLCQHVLTRLKALSEVVKGVGSSDRELVAGELEAAVAEALLALEVQGESESLVHKITTSQRFIARMHLVHKRVDSIYQVLGVGEAKQQALWRDTFHGDCIKLEEWLEEKLELSTDAMLHNENPGTEKERAVLAALGMQLELWSTGEQRVSELQLSKKLADLMEQTLDRTTEYAEARKRTIVTCPSQVQHQSFSNAAKNLSKIRDKATTVPGSDHLCLRVSNRLEALLSRLNDDNQWWPVIDYYHNTASGFLTMLRIQNHYNYLLYRLATSQRVIDQVTQAHSRLDVICEVLGVLEDAHLVNDWRANWAIDRNRQEKYFADTLGQRSEEELVNEVPNPGKLMETLTTLNNQLRMRSHELATADVGSMMTGATDLTTEMANLMSTALYRITNFTDIHLENAFSWFVSAEDIKRDSGKNAEPIMVGTFGQVYKGTWTNEWTKEERSVAIKQLFRDDSESTDRFSREIATWSKLHHENILEMLGANHVSRIKFFISEFATEGNFWDFFDHNDENKKLLWELFRQAATGLQYIHENHVEHGELKMTNLLVTRAGTGESAKLVAKVSDFGMAVVRTQSVSVSIHEKSASIRWKAPERMIQSTDPIDFRQSDTYSLGLCIWAAASGEDPYALDDDESILEKKLEHIPVDRPDGAFTDAEWQLVASMVDNNPENRPSLEDAIQRMRELDVIRQRHWPFKEEATRVT